MRSSKITFKCDRCWEEQIFTKSDMESREESLRRGGWIRILVGNISDQSNGHFGNPTHGRDLCPNCTSRFQEFIDGAALALATDRLGGEAGVPQPDPTLSQSTETKV